MRLPLRRVFTVLGLLCCTAIAAAVGVAVGSSATADRRERITVAQGAFEPVSASRARRSRVRLIRVTATSTVQPNQFDGVILSCPRSDPHTVGGFFDSGSSEVVLTSNRPHPLNSTTSRRWTVGVTNYGTGPAAWVAGLVCARY